MTLKFKISKLVKMPNNAKICSSAVGVKIILAVRDRVRRLCKYIEFRINIFFTIR